MNMFTVVTEHLVEAKDAVSAVEADTGIPRDQLEAIDCYNFTLIQLKKSKEKIACVYSHFTLKH